MTVTQNRLGPSSDLPLAIQKELGQGARVKAGEPLLSIALPTGDSVTIQEGGDIAIFRAIGFDHVLLCCQCSGEVVNEIPRRAVFQIAFKFGNTKQPLYRLYRLKDEYFSFDGDKFIHFHNHINPEDDDRNMVEQNAPEECSLFHTNDTSLDDDYRRLDESREEYPIPGPGQGDQTTNSLIVSGEDDDQNRKPFDPPPGLDHACETHTLPAFIPDEYLEEYDKDEMIRLPEKKEDRDPL